MPGLPDGSIPYSINNSGHIAGVANAHAFFYQNGVMTDLGTLAGDNYSSADSINDRGQIVGESENMSAASTQARVTHAFLLIPSD